MFPQYLEGITSILYIFVCMLFLLLKIICFDKYNKWQLFGVLLAFGIGILTYIGSKDLTPFILILLVVSAKDIDFDKILKVWLVVVISIMLLAFAASMLDIIENLQYKAHFLDKTDSIRNSFGIVYPTDFGAHIFFIVVTAFYLKRNRLKWFDFLIALAVAGLLYYFCQAKLDSGSIVLAVLLFGIARAIDCKGTYNLKKLWKSIWNTCGCLITPLMCGATIVVTMAYKAGDAIDDIDNLGTIAARLRLGQAAIKDYGIKPFGQKLDLIGAGGSTNHDWSKYNYIDASYIQILVCQGISYFALIITTYIAICIKHRRNIYLLCAVAMISLNCMIAHHMIAIEYNVFTLALLALVDKTERNDS